MDDYRPYVRTPHSPSCARDDGGWRCASNCPHRERRLSQLRAAQYRYYRRNRSAILARQKKYRSTSDETVDNDPTGMLQSPQ
jgi:hypothetical protein